MNAQLLIGRVWHRRRRPVLNEFSYPVIQIAFALDALQSLARPWLSLNRFNLFSFHEADHGARDGSPLLPWIRAILERERLDRVDGEIRLQTMPRMLGFVFNPISFWYCHDRAGALRAVVCEVNNTFGGTHSYLIAHADQRPIEDTDVFESPKRLHVSPFCEIEGHYRFRFRVMDDGIVRVRIDYHDAAGPLLDTAITTRARPLTGMRLLQAFLQHGWNTLATWLRIHFQALRLWTRGVPFHGRRPLATGRETDR